MRKFSANIFETTRASQMKPLKVQKKIENPPWIIFKMNPGISEALEDIIERNWDYV
jgi:hypothetical protein